MRSCVNLPGTKIYGNMNDIRIGKDFNVQWAIHKVVDGQRLPYDLVGKELQLYIVNDNGRKEVAGWKVQGNVIEWTYLGKDQKRLGAYQLILVENAGKEGMVTVDTCKAFNLVEHSCEENVDGGNDIVIKTVTLESEVALAPVVKEIGSAYDDTEIKKDIATLKEKNAEQAEQLTELSSKLSELEQDIEVGKDIINFTNPVGPHCPDPCFWKADDGYFYIKGTGRISEVLRTRDFVNYEDTGRTFLSETALQWLNDNYGHLYNDGETIVAPHCWAPFVIKIGNNWVLYMAVVERYELGMEGVLEDGAAHIVAFTSRTPYGDFTNPVTIVSDGDFMLTNSVVWNNVIDPFVYCNPQDQKLYLVAGSSYSIGRLELTDDGLATVLEKGVGNKCVRMAGLTISSDPSREQVYEGAYIYSRPNKGTMYHYLFASKGHYAEDNYALVAFRCTDLNAKAGDSTNGWSDINGISPITKVNTQSAKDRVILSGYSKDSGEPWGPGHCAGIFETVDGKTWMLYHCHKGNGTNDRQLFIQEILWDEKGWPYFETSYPTKEGCVSSVILSGNIDITTKSISPVISITHSSLVKIRNNGELIPGQHYRIIDYVTTTTESNTKSADHPFDVIVLALSENTLAEEAYAIQSARDTDGYFANSNLFAWKLWYSLDNDSERFAWADTDNGKGVIYRMIDEWNNDVPYDFKNIQFKRGVYDGGGIAPDGDEDMHIHLFTFSFRTEDNDIIDTSIFGNNGRLLNDEGQITGVYGNVIGQYMNYDTSIDSPTKTAQRLNDIVFYSHYDFEGDTYYGCYYNSFGNDCYYNSFGNGCYYNSFGNDCYYNSFGNDCYYNSFGNGCYSNSFGNGCNYNSFGNSSMSNELKAYYRYITFGEGVQWVTLQNETEGDYENQVQNYRVANGTHGEYDNPLVVDVTRNMGCETFIGMDSNDELKVFCLADLLNS